MENRKRLFIVAGLLGAVAVVLLGVYLAGPLFFDRTVEEAFPFEMPDSAELSGFSDDEMAALEEDFEAAVPDEETLAGLSEEDRAAVEEKVMEAAAAMPDHEMEEAMPGQDPVLLKSGQFEDADSFHQGAGDARIYQLPDGTRVLRLEEFSVTNGPDLHVLLASGDRPASRGDLGEYVDLGSLKGNLGNQNYEIPPDVDLDSLNSVVIYCQPFHVVFSIAPLN